MKQKVTHLLIRSIIEAVFYLVLFFAFLALLPTCDKNPIPPNEPDPVPPDTVIVEIPVFVTCDTVDLEVEFTLIKDQSAPNVYAVFRNGVEVRRIVISEMAPVPTEVTFLHTFENFVIGQETIAIKKIEGSRAETIGSAIIGIECSD